MPKNNVNRAESDLVVSCPELEEIVFSKDVRLDTKSGLVKNCPKLRQVSCYQNMETILVE